MTGPEHRQAAERLLSSAAVTSQHVAADPALAAQIATAHALLALGQQAPLVLEGRGDRARRDHAAAVARRQWESGADGPPAVATITGGEVAVLEHILRALALHGTGVSWDEPLQQLSEEVVDTLFKRVAAAEQRGADELDHPTAASEGGA